ncbi:MAG: hypothetical protein ABIS84_00325 [Arachnia sp.]
MTVPETRRRNPMHVAIAALSIALVAVAALVAFLIWGRPAPTVEPVPSPTPSSSPTSQPPSQSPTATQTPVTTTPATPVPASTAATTAAEASAPATTTAAASPAASPVTTTAPASPAASPAAAQTMMWQGKATFEHFTAEVLADDANQDAPMIEGKAGLLVEVCATEALAGTGTVRISSDPWTLQDSDGNAQKAQQGGYEPAFPTDAEYAVGACARGYLTFDYLSVDSDYANLVYENGLGDRAVWQFH